MKKLYFAPNPHCVLMNLKRQLKTIKGPVYLENPISYIEHERLDGGSYTYKCYRDCRIIAVLGGKTPKVLFDRDAVGPVYMGVKDKLTCSVPLSQLNASQRENVSFALAYSLAKKRAAVENRREAEIRDLSYFIASGDAEQVHLMWTLMNEIFKKAKR